MGGLPLLAIGALVPKLLNHRVDVREGTLGRLVTPFTLLHVAHLDLHLFTRLLRQLLHVALHELNLGVQVSVSNTGVFKFLFQLQVPDLKLMNLPLVLLFALFKCDV